MENLFSSTATASGPRTNFILFSSSSEESVNNSEAGSNPEM